MNSCIPQIEVDGRVVTVKFEMPFMPGDACVTPRHGHATQVSRAPDVRIELADNLGRAVVSFGGAWYSANHTQMHGVGEYLPDMDAFLAFWLRQPTEHFRDCFSWLTKKFAGQPQALEALHANRIRLKEAEVAAMKSELAESILTNVKTLNALEVELAELRGGAA